MSYNTNSQLMVFWDFLLICDYKKVIILFCFYLFDSCQKDKKLLRKTLEEMSELQLTKKKATQNYQFY